MKNLVRFVKVQFSNASGSVSKALHVLQPDRSLITTIYDDFNLYLFVCNNHQQAKTRTEKKYNLSQRRITN